MSKINIRKANASDMEGVHRMVQELADYEKLSDQVETSPETLVRDGFGERPLFECFVAETEEDGIVGIAFFYFGYSTWKGKNLYLEDLVVTESYRRKGIGKLFFDALVAYAREQSVREMRWHVLDWNEPAIKFYQKINASLDPTWTTCKLTAKKLELYQ